MQYPCRFLARRQYQRVIELLGALHPVGKPVDDVFGVIPIDGVDMVKPTLGFIRLAGTDQRRPVEVEAGHPAAREPAAFGDQPVAEQHFFARRPSHLFDRAVAVEPSRSRDPKRLAGLLALHRLTVGIIERHARHADSKEEGCALSSMRALPELPCL
jgi:hypothetical protein